MADHVLEARLWLARPRPEVFAFFADPRNLARITPPGVHFHLRTDCTQLSAGAVLDVGTRWLGVPLRARFYVREYDPPYRFVDVPPGAAGRAAGRQHGGGRVRPAARDEIGAHVSIAGGLHLALERGRALGCGAVQIFLKNQRQWAARPLGGDEV